MSIKALDFVKAMIILIFGIIIIGAIIEGEFGISDAATKIFLSIGGLGIVAFAFRTWIKKNI